MSETTTQAERHVDILKRADVVADEQINDRFISYNNTVTISKHFIEEFEEVSSAPDPGEDLAKTVAKKSHMENYPGQARNSSMTVLRREKMRSRTRSRSYRNAISPGIE